MKNAIDWICKLAVCWGLGFLAWKYLNLFSHWMDEKIGFPFLAFLVSAGFVGVLYFFAWIDRKLGLDKLKNSVVRGVLCAAAGVPTVVVAAVDFWKQTYSSGWAGVFYLVFIHVLFAGMLFAIGSGPDALK